VLNGPDFEFLGVEGAPGHFVVALGTEFIELKKRFFLLEFYAVDRFEFGFDFR